jgi:hypothetical protein
MRIETMKNMNTYDSFSAPLRLCVKKCEWQQRNLGGGIGLADERDVSS